MKKVILAVFCIAISSSVFAGHFKLQGVVGEAESTFLIKDMAIPWNTFKANEQGYHEFKAATSELRNDNSILNKANCKEYISETGQVHVLADLFIHFETFLLNANEENFEMSGKQDAGVIYILKRKGAIYSIDIYTAKDAYLNEGLVK